ncbi:lysophospholipid acyltransferase family protein [Mycobacterium sp. shizuoka-1]|uniref:lysophospholipid acyltransferase family protein n=1 Tax=Mycobacterium sp. shizuoka-1 TaxID=2039281 RepID=UPI000C062196|nr:lysophospholipid acyltransferase family protein [Mycobacterium sp. shizuoka-1]GAY19242.1 membrane protein [Mycobacterium sp. shizuoka-1]
MTAVADIDQITNPPRRVRALRPVVESVLDGLSPVIDLYRPYVDGLENLPRDGRFLLVGNHTHGAGEVVLIPYFVRQEIGTRVRPLAVTAIRYAPGIVGDALAAYGAVVGHPDTARELMRNDETILVFPGGGREMNKFKGEEHTLLWKGRAGFARVAVESSYPIVPVALVGGDDVYKSVFPRDSAFGRFTTTVMERVTGKPEMGLPLTRGVGLTTIPRPQRMYLRFGSPIDTTKPTRRQNDSWVADVKAQTQDALEQQLAGLLEIRSQDPYRQLNPLAWSRATRPPVRAAPAGA